MSKLIQRNRYLKISVLIIGACAASLNITAANALTDVGLQEYNQKSVRDQIGILFELVKAKYPDTYHDRQIRLTEEVHKCIDANSRKFSPFFVLKDVCVDMAGEKVK